MNTNRKSVSHYEERYTRYFHDPINRFTCIYCGVHHGITMDHVPPISRVPDYEALDLQRPLYIKVPACKQCNSLLGNTLQCDILERIQVAKDLLRRKLAKDLRCALEAADVEEMGPTLRAVMESAIESRDLAEARLEYWDGFQYLLDELSL